MHSADRYANLVERVEKSVERVHKRYMQGDTAAYLDLIFGILQVLALTSMRLLMQYTTVIGRILLLE